LAPEPPPGAGEDQVRWISPGWELPADRLGDRRGEGDLANAGVALGSWLEAAAVLAAGLVADLDDLEHGHRTVEVDAAAAQPGQLAEADGTRRMPDISPVGRNEW
jgi:hypothetical protein